MTKYKNIIDFYYYSVEGGGRLAGQDRLFCRKTDRTYRDASSRVIACFCLDKPLVVRYFSWLLGILTFNPGTSYAYNMNVGTLIAQRLPVTLGMSAIAMLMVILISYPLAVLSARKPGRLGDQICSVIGHVLFAIPPYVASLLLIMLASSVFSLLTVGTYVTPAEDFAGYVGCLLLPSFAVALPKIAMSFKFLRSSIIEQRASDYVRTSKSHGLSDLKILVRHVLPNSNVSSITIISIILSDILGGSLIVGLLSGIHNSPPLFPLRHSSCHIGPQDKAEIRRISGICLLQTDH